MIAEAYDRRAFSDAIVRTDEKDLATTVSQVAKLINAWTQGAPSATDLKSSTTD